MFISKKEYFVEVHAILVEGVDFVSDDLEPNLLVGGKLLELSSEARRNIAYNKNYLSMHWCGHYNPVSKTIECTFRNPLYVEEETKTFIERNTVNIDK